MKVRLSAPRNVAVFLLISTGSVVAHAQGDPELSALLQIAPPPTNATLPVPYGYVDLTNGNLHLSIPYTILAGPNGRSTTLSVNYNSRTLQEFVSGYYEFWVPTQDYGWQSKGGADRRVTFREDQNVPESGCSNSSNQYPHWSNFAYSDSAGAHVFPTEFQMNCNPIGSVTASSYAQDGSGYFAWFSTDAYLAPVAMKVWSPSGDLVYNGSPAGVSSAPLDSNGTWLDYTSGSLPSTSISSTSATEYMYVPASALSTGAVQEINSSHDNVKSLTLPDGRSFSMTYDVCPNGQACTDSIHTGILKSVTLPTGGKITFGYVTFAVPDDGDSTAADIRVTSVSLSGETAQNCAPASATAGTTWSLCWRAGGVDILEPQGTTGLRSLTTRDLFATGSQTTVSGVKTYSGSTAVGTPLEEVAYSNFNGRLPADIVIKHDGVLVSKTHYVLWDQSLPMIANIQQEDGSGNILRETAYTFTPYLGTYNHPSSLTNHYIDRPVTMKSYGAGGSGGAAIAGALFNYDEAALSATSGFSNHSVTGLSWHDDAHFGSSMLSRGNLTSVQRMSAGGAYATTNVMSYNILGQLVTSTDGNGNITNHDWFSGTFGDTTCSSAAVFFFDAQVKNALNQQSANVYDSCTGTVHAQKTPNDLAANRAGTVFQYDAGGRLINTLTPEGGSTTVQYTDGPNSIVKTTVQAGGGATRVSNVYLDPFGRGSKTEIIASSADGGNVMTDTQVDFAGAAASIHGPYTSTKPGGTTTTVYDALHRATSVSREGVVQSTATYNGLSTTQTDGKSNQIITTNNVLGQLASTLEAGSSSVPFNLLTEYGYDGLGNLMSVNQHGAASDTAVTRSFNYDPLSRLVQAYNPESGWVCYGTLSAGSKPDGSNCTGDAAHTGYDGNNNLAKKIDARGATTLFSYDKLNRLTARGGPASSSINSCFLYDTDSSTNPAESTGLLVSEWTQLGSCPSQSTTVPATASVTTTHRILAYDEVGRVKSQSNCVMGSCSLPRTQTAHYNTDGSLKDFGNGLGGAATLAMGYDTAGRLYSVSTCGFAGQAACSSATQASMTFRYGPVGWSGARFGGNIFLSRYFDLFNRVTGMAASPTE